MYVGSELASSEQSSASPQMSFARGSKIWHSTEDDDVADHSRRRIWIPKPLRLYFATCSGDSVCTTSPLRGHTRVCMCTPRVGGISCYFLLRV